MSRRVCAGMIAPGSQYDLCAHIKRACISSEINLLEIFRRGKASYMLDECNTISVIVREVEYINCCIRSPHIIQDKDRSCSNSPLLMSDVHNQSANTALSYTDKTRASA